MLPAKRVHQSSTLAAPRTQKLPLRDSCGTTKGPEKGCHPETVRMWSSVFLIHATTERLVSKDS